MVTSIKLTGKYNIGVSESKAIKVNIRDKESIVALKDIPFVRYDFGKYGVDELNYIKQSIQKFNLSTHLIQFRIGEDLLTQLNTMSELFDKVAKYLYFTIEQSDFISGQLKETDLQYATQATQICNFDRIMIIDKTANMDMANAKQIIKNTAKRLNVNIDKIGLCSSPLCMTQEMACLTALKARELASIYSNNTEVALPSANHQDMNCCGCMRFFTVTGDMEAPIDNKVKKTSEKKSDNNKPNTKKTAKPKNIGVYSLSNFV